MTLPEPSVTSTSPTSPVGAPGAILPALPTELLLNAFEYLNVNDIRRILNVNSYFKTIAQPLAYCCGVFTQFGPFSPATLSEPDARLPCLTEDEQHYFSSRVRGLDVYLHSSEMCRAFRFHMRNKLKFDLDVLNLVTTGYRWDRGEDFWDQYVHHDSYPPLPAPEDMPNPLYCQSTVLSYDPYEAKWQYPSPYAKCFSLYSSGRSSTCGSAPTSSAASPSFRGLPCTSPTVPASETGTQTRSSALFPLRPT